MKRHDRFKKNKPIENVKLQEGIVQVHEKGFAFVDCGDDCPDIHINRRKLATAMNGDKVLVSVREKPLLVHNKKEYRPEGEIIKILERANKEVIGTLEHWGSNYIIYPQKVSLREEIMVTVNGIGDAKPGDKVIAKIVKWPSRNNPAIAKVIKVLGAADAQGVDMLSLLWEHGVAMDFATEVLKEAEKAAMSFTEADFINRKDFRNLSVITIDGADAKDLDDAVSCEALPEGGWRLGVYIADVAHYVKVDSLLEQEAFSRGTSIYLPDRVMPMLPPALSNSICSLHPDADRLVLACIMEIGPKGKIRKYEIQEGIIRSECRFTYDIVNQLLELSNENLAKKYAKWLPMLQEMSKLQQILMRKRVARGALNFDFPETNIIMDEKTGKVLDIRKRVSKLAEKIIEEFMIAANETVAGEFNRRKIPFIYRVHEKPSLEKLENLNMAVGPLGYGIRLDLENLTPKTFQKMLNSAKGLPEEHLVQLFTLRSMSHAYYTVDPIGHFGLASQYYSHFTSPIRRYADLSIHRVIKKYLTKNPQETDHEKLNKTLAASALQASKQERFAEEMEREAITIKCCEYMKEHLGDIYTGKVSGVTGYGVYVELDNTVEGRIGLDDLPSPNYKYNHDNMLLVGNKGDKWQLGDLVTIQVSRVDVQSRQIDFVLAKNEEA
jgi:ribonuclease R